MISNNRYRLCVLRELFTPDLDVNVSASKNIAMTITKNIGHNAICKMCVWRCLSLHALYQTQWPILTFLFYVLELLLVTDSTLPCTYVKYTKCRYFSRHSAILEICQDEAGNQPLLTSWKILGGSVTSDITESSSWSN